MRSSIRGMVAAAVLLVAAPMSAAVQAPAPPGVRIVGLEFLEDDAGHTFVEVGFAEPWVPGPPAYFSWFCQASTPEWFVDLSVHAGQGQLSASEGSEPMAAITRDGALVLQLPSAGPQVLVSCGAQPSEDDPGGYGEVAEYVPAGTGGTLGEADLVARWDEAAGGFVFDVPTPSEASTPAEGVTGGATTPPTLDGTSPPGEQETAAAPSGEDGRRWWFGVGLLLAIATVLLTGTFARHRSSRTTQAGPSRRPHRVGGWHTAGDWMWADPEVLDTGPGGVPTPFAADSGPHVGLQVSIRQPLQALSSGPRTFVRILRISIPETGETVVLQHAERVLDDLSTQDRTVFQWVPETSGTYKVEMWVGRSMDDPTTWQRTADTTVTVQ